MQKVSLKRWIVCLIIPVAVGALSALLTSDAMEVFMRLRQPQFSPPGWVFPIVWTILYLLMGAASCLVVQAETNRKRIRPALTVYGIQLVVNFLWSILFFNAQAYLAAFLWLIFLWLLIWVNLILFARIRKTAAYLLIPYLLWVTFAGYLNLGVYVLN